MHRSIRTRLTLTLVIIIVLAVGLSWTIFMIFGEKYYLYTEKKNIINVYMETKSLLSESDNVLTENELERISGADNIKMVIVKTDDVFYYPEVVFSNVKQGSRRYEKVIKYLDSFRRWTAIEGGSDLTEKKLYIDFGNDTESDLVDLEQLYTNGYFVTHIKDKYTGRKSMYLFGYDKNGFLYCMETSIEEISASAHVGSRFMLLTGIIGIVAGSIIMMYVSGRFTKPISEMAKVADRMAALDFDARINTDQEDELADLGKAMNSMSKKLEATIGDIKSANIELRKDIARKQEIDDMRKEFISHVSHELKTPIAIISGYAEGLKENINEDAESKDFYCDVIMDEASRMNTMVRRLLSLSQLESGDQPLDMTRFDITAMINNKISAASLLIQKKTAVVTFAEKESINVWGDEYLIEEVFGNYFSNAINYVEPAGEIRIWYEKRGRDLRVHVYNDGRTISDDELEKLWIKFYKADKARTREYGGNGIGLSIVAAAMKAHGKDYGVENKEKGVDFYFDIDCYSV